VVEVTDPGATIDVAIGGQVRLPRQLRRELGVQRREIEPGRAGPHQFLGLGHRRGELQHVRPVSLDGGEKIPDLTTPGFLDSHEEPASQLGITGRVDVHTGRLQIRLEERDLHERKVHGRLHGRYRVHPRIEPVHQRLDNSVGPEKTCLIIHVQLLGPENSQAIRHGYNTRSAKLPHYGMRTSLSGT
jgi:hypothetical protein